MNVKFLIILIVFTCFFKSADAQKLEFEHLSDHEGLTGTSVTAIFKDSHEYMWFGFFEGLSRYNGYEFKNYNTNPNNPTSINDNFIRCIFENKSQILVIGFQNRGICVYNRDTDSFTRYTHNDNDSNSIINDNILTIKDDNEGNLWIGTKGGLDQFNFQKGTFKHYNIFPEDGIVVSSIAKDPDGGLWIYGCGDKVCKFNYKNNTFNYIKITEGINLNKVSFKGGAIAFDKKKNLWIGNETNGITRYNTITGSKEYYNTSNKKLKSDIVFSFQEDSDGDIWIGTDGAGMYRYNYKSDTLYNYQNSPNDPTSLSGNAVYSIYESEPGVIWAGVYASGINVYKRQKRKFNSITTKGRTGEILTQKSVLSLAEYDQSKVWIGTDGGGLNLFDLKKSKIEVFNKDNSPLNSNVIKSIARDNYNQLWLGSYGNGLSRLKIVNQGGKIQFLNSHFNYKKLRGDHVWSFLNTNNYMWIGFLNFGVGRYNFKTDFFEVMHYDSIAESNAGCDMNVIFQDSKKRIWFGAYLSGLGYFNEKDQTFIKFKNNKQNKYSISDNDINTIYEDSKGNIWIGTRKGGLNKLINFEKGKFINYSTTQGLSSNNIRSIEEDNNGDLWLGTANGISVFKIREDKFVNFDINDGISSKEFNTHSSLKASNGYLYFGGTTGLTYFNPNTIEYNLKKPKIVLTDFKIFNTSLHAGIKYNGKVYLNKPIDLSNDIELSHSDNVFSIEFAALDFLTPLKNKYAYRMMGFHDNWNYVTANKRFATYTNLDPGTYKFQVIACNNDGIWNRNPTSLKITILPPWWQTFWFRLASSAAIILMLILFYYLRLKSIHARNEYLTREVKKRTTELHKINSDLKDKNEEIVKQRDEIVNQKNKLESLNQTKDKFFSIIGHDLKGPVNALTFLTNMLNKDWDTVDPESKKEYIRHIDNSSNQVKNLVHALLEWARTQSGQVTMEPKPLVIQKVIGQNVEFLLEQATQKKISIEVKCDENLLAYGDENMISTIIRNILSNSIKYSFKEGRILISAEYENSTQMVISIKDEGMGMSPTTLNKIFALDKGPSIKGTNKEIGTGLGMIISQEFAMMNGGLISVESNLGKGSLFKVQLPAIIKTLISLNT